MKVRRLAVAVLMVALVAIATQGFACNAYHDLVVGEHDFKSTVQAFQGVESNEFAAGNIAPALHMQLEEGILKVAQGGQQLTSLLQQNASNQSVIAQIQLINTSLQELNSNGVLGIKNPVTKQNVQLALQAVQAILSNVATALNAPAGTVTPISTGGAQ